MRLFAICYSITILDRLQVLKIKRIRVGIKMEVNLLTLEGNARNNTVDVASDVLLHLFCSQSNAFKKI
jgi:hypothetical protein